MAESSEVQRFYSGCTIFLTGGTGFVGKLTLEGLLRKCPDIRRIYVLVRMKKQKQHQQRLQELLECPIFDPLKRLRPDFIKKITMIHGDMLKPDLGISDEDRDLIIKEVDIVIHCAATVRFDQTLSQATKINVIGTRDLLRMAKKMQRLKAFVHVSTAYSNCDRKEIDEIIYEPKLEGQKLINAVEALNDDLLKAMEKNLLGNLPNTYTLTKQIAEDVVRQEGQTLPVCIVRPSIVIATVEEPLTGFTDNFYGPTGLFLGVGTGLLRTILGNKKNKADLVPADFVANHIITSGWHIGTNRITREPCNPEVINFVSCSTNSLTWGEYMDLGKAIGPCYATEKMLFYPFTFLQPSKWLHILLHYLLHIFPAYIIDSIMYMLNKPQVLLKMYKQVSRAADTISYFPMREWEFQDAKTRMLLSKMSPQDRRLFNFDISTVNWEDYMHNYSKGMRVYVLKDPMDTLPQGKKHFFKLKMTAFAFLAVLTFLLFKTVQFVVKMIFF